MTRQPTLRVFLHVFRAGVFVIGATLVAGAQSITLGFPVAGQNPYTAPIITVLDHSTDFFYDQAHTEVLAYTGEMGVSQCGPSKQPCGYYNPNFSPQNDNDTKQFIVNGSYVGTSADCTALNQPSTCLEKTKILNYRGHSGYDYNYGPTTQIVAAQAGTLYIPAGDMINNFGGGDPWCTFHTFFIDHGNGLTTWYLHADHLIVGTLQPHACPNSISRDEPIAQVKKGDAIAVVGSMGAASPHLHFEVRRGCDFANGAAHGCMVVDPYGWEWWTGDTIQNTVCATDPSKHCATVQTTPLWNVSDFNVRLPVVLNVSLAQAANGFTATISGQNFDPGALVTLWSRQGQYHLANVSPSSLSTTQIIAQLPSTIVPDPGSVVLKVRNPGGPRSVAMPLSVTSGTSSVPLVINGQSAPDGGTFAGFAGFESANDRGQVSFSAGVDTNGDGTPDTFTDFAFSSGQIIKLTVPGFTNISSVVSHPLINNRGDMAFGDVNGAFGASPAGIYILTSGSSTSTQIVTHGGPCPTPCPVSGPVVIDELTGPLAISEASDVSFAAGLVNPQTHIATCCYLFLYSASNASITRIASDGPNGDISPVGGTFTAGAFLGGINLITSDGDVIFLAQVTGGSSQGGIFRFSRGHGFSKLVAQGDPVPGSVGGVFGFPLMGRVGSVSGRQLVFHAPIVGGSAGQVIVLVRDVTQNNPTSITVVAFEGQATGTSAGGFFSNASRLPFGFFGENTAPPWVRVDGSVVFHSLLTNAVDASGNPTDRGLFLWNGSSFQKIVVNGDSVSAGAHIQGVFAPAVNNRGEVFYFAATIQ